MKKFCGAFGLTVLVTLKFELVNVLVASGVHCATGSVRFVVESTANCEPGVPLVPEITKLVPDRIILVMCGCAAGPVTPAVMLPLTAKLFVQVSPVAVGKVTALKEPAL